MRGSGRTTSGIGRRPIGENYGSAAVLTPRTAALAGPVTRIPGLFYLVALNVVVAHPSVVEGLFEVLLHNAIWFLIPIGALVVIVLVVSFGAGTALVLRGVLTL